MTVSKKQLGSNVLAAALIGMLGALSACAPPASPNLNAESALRRRSEAVVVDYYDAAGQQVRTCAGTLLSPNVVIAPAHCADGTAKATVTAANARRTRTTVSKVYTYDWAAADLSMKASTRHDVALLVLRRTIADTRLARVQRQVASGADVVQIGRSRAGGTSLLSLSKPLRLGAWRGASSPTRVLVGASRVTARGGALYRITANDERVIVGVVIGHGQHSGTGVVVPLSDSTMQRWIRAVVMTEDPNAKANDAATSTRTASVRILADDTDTSTDTSSDTSTSTDSSSASDGSEQVDDESTSSAPTTEDAPAASETTDPSSTSPDPVVDAPTPTDPSSTDPSSTDPSPTDPSPTDPSSTTTDPSPTDPSPAPDATPPATDPVVLTGDGSNDGTTTTTPATTDTPTTDSSTYDDTQASSPTATADPAAPPATDPATPSAPNQTEPPYPGKIAGVGSLRSPATDEQTTLQPGGNAVTVASPGDPAFADDAKIAQRYAGAANIYNSHGMPGTLLGGVPADTVKSFLADDKPLIVASCFSAAPMTGGSTIRRVVSAYGDDPSVASRVYGCSGYASGDDANGLGCTGTWLDANGHAVPADERSRLDLHQYQCSTNTLDASGRPVWSDCAAND